MEKFSLVDDANFRCKQFCHTHKKQCPLFGPSTEAQLEVAGLPCWDMSRAGRQMKEEGPTAGVFLCHAKRHAEKRTPMIIIENTKALHAKTPRVS